MKSPNIKCLNGYDVLVLFFGSVFSFFPLSVSLSMVYIARNEEKMIE